MDAALISLVIPVLSDAEALERLLVELLPDATVEVVVVDGGNDVRLNRLVTRPDVRLVRVDPGRARQMNAGAAVATGAWLLFLHADSRLPPDWLAAVRSAIASGAIGGWFRFALDDDAWQARVIERGVKWRVRLFRLPYGDQGILVKRTAFEAMAGFREWPLMEDVDFVRRLAQRGQVMELPAALATSSRRWRRDGWFRRSARNLVLVGLYLAGVKPATLARWY
jgi:rSAM/selenodomain-associated transferase 2